MDLRRDDDDLSSRLIVEGIWRKLESADVVLCDLSAHNPNVYLELGWTLRSDKKFILIKDEITDFSFDLNQLHTCAYDSRLQPTNLKRDVANLAEALKATHDDDENRYSLVKRMALSAKIELDPSEDSAASLVEMIYKKLDCIQIGSPIEVRKSREEAGQGRVVITDIGEIYPTINRRKTLDWPNPELKSKAGSDYWGDWKPSDGDEGRIIHESWHKSKESVVYVVEVDGYFVPIGSGGVKVL